MVKTDHLLKFLILVFLIFNINLLQSGGLRSHVPSPLQVSIWLPLIELPESHVNLAVVTDPSVFRDTCPFGGALSGSHVSR